MKKRHFLFVSILLMAVSVTVSSCSQYSYRSDGYYGGDTMNAEQLSKILASLNDETTIFESYDISCESCIISDELDNNEVYYWTANGEVLHKDGKCRYLKNSKEIQSGSAEEAFKAGKKRKCSSCFK